MRHIQEKPALLELLARHIRTKGVSEVVLKILTQNSSSDNDMFIVKIDQNGFFLSF